MKLTVLEPIVDREEVRESYKKGLKGDYLVFGIIVLVVVFSLLLVESSSVRGIDLILFAWVFMLYWGSSIGRDELLQRLKIVESLLREQRGDE